MPVLWELEQSRNAPSDTFVDRLTKAIYAKYNLLTAPNEKIILSARQRDMLPYLSKGMSYAEIADETGLGYNAIKSYVRLLYKALGVHDAKQAVSKAKALGLFDHSA